MTPLRHRMPPNTRAGFSLLEVLVACGILVIALGSIAAILPAAGSQLAEASAQDRAAAAAALAMSEVRCRNLVARDMFPGSLGGTAPSVVFGETLSMAVTESVNRLGYASGITATGALTSGSAVLAGTLSVGSTPILSVANTGTLGSRIQNNTDLNVRRGYLLEEEIQYRPPVTGELPRNSFENGARQFNRGICWGAIITPAPWGVTTGSVTTAKVSVAVFRKPGGAATAMTLTSSTTGPSAAAGIFRLSGTATPAALQRTILKPCSSVLGISGSVPPQWLAIRSSWVAGTNPMSTVSSATTCVIFENASLAQPLVSGSTITVIGFENLLLVNERIVPVQ